MPGECKVGRDAVKCPSGTFCYAGENARAGDRGVCTQLPPDVLPFDSPTIHGFEPLEAAHGATLTIQGASFSAVPSENSVTLNGVPAVLVSAVPDELKVVVPKSTLCSGPVRVTVAGETVVSSASFTYVPTAASVTTVAGDGTTTRLNGPCGIALGMGTDDNLYVTDFGNHRIRKITPQGEMSTFAGTSSSEPGHNDGIGANARFWEPCGITANAEGHFYVTDGGADNGRIRQISMQAQVSSLADNMQGFAQNPESREGFRSPRGLAMDADGTLHVADSGNHRIRKISPEGRVLTLAGNGMPGSADGKAEEAQFNVPRGVAMDVAGNLYVADGANSRIRKVSPEGRVSTLSDGQGFVENPGNVMHFRLPRSIAIDKMGILYVVDTDSHHIQQILPSGKANIFVGNGTQGFADGPKEVAQFHSPRELIIDAEGNLLLADYGNNRIRKIVLE